MLLYTSSKTIAVCFILTALFCRVRNIKLNIMHQYIIYYYGLSYWRNRKKNSKKSNKKQAPLSPAVEHNIDSIIRIQ